MISVAISLYAFISISNAHSWARCTDYHAEITGGDYDESQCTGWIRGWEYDNIDFGADRGINYQVEVGGGQNLCQNTLSGTADSDYGYANTEKIAQYTSGSTVRVVWPAKNHANYECFGNIPDASMKLYMNPNINPTADLTNAGGVSMGTAGYVLVKDWQEGCTAGSDGCGFQNCPQFCANTDRATCFGDFIVPDVDTAGYYTFVWYWIFNPGAPYISCYEAYVEPATETTTGNNNGEIIDGNDENNNDAVETVFNPSSGGETGSLNGYITRAPLCVTHGDDYDANGLDAFASGRLSSVSSESDSMDIVSVDSDVNSFNFTIQISRSSPGIALTNALDGENHDNAFCDGFENTYPGTTCENCQDVITYALYDRSAADGMRVGWILVISFVLAIFV